MVKNNIIDDIFGTEEEIRNMVRKKLPEYLLNGQMQPQLYLTISNLQTNEESLYLLKPIPHDKHHKGKEAIKTFQLNPSLDSKLNETYEQFGKLNIKNNYRNCA